MSEETSRAKRRRSGTGDLPAGAGDDGTLCRLRAFLPAARRLPSGLSGGRASRRRIRRGAVENRRRFSSSERRCSLSVVLQVEFCHGGSAGSPVYVFPQSYLSMTAEQGECVGRFSVYGIADGSDSLASARFPYLRTALYRMGWIVRGESGSVGLASRAVVAVFLCKNGGVRCRGRRRDFMASGGRCEPDSSSGRRGGCRRWVLSSRRSATAGRSGSEVVSPFRDSADDRSTVVRSGFLIRSAGEGTVSVFSSHLSGDGPVCLLRRIRRFGGVLADEIETIRGGGFFPASGVRRSRPYGLPGGITGRIVPKTGMNRRRDYSSPFQMDQAFSACPTSMS